MSDAARRIESTAMGPQLARSVRELIDRTKQGNAFTRVTVVTPSFYSSFFLRRAIAPSGLFNVEFVRIDEVAEVLAAEKLRAQGTTALGRLQASELVYAAVAQSLPPSSVLGKIRSYEATQLALHRTFTELSAVEAPRVELLPTGRHFDDLKEAYQRYRTLSKPFHDRTTVARLAAQAVTESNGVLSDRFGTLLVVLVEAPPPQYSELWRAIVNQPGVFVTLGLSGDPTADNLVTGLGGWTGNRGVTQRYALPRLVSAQSRTEELKLLVRNIAQDVRQGVLLNRIAVLYADPTYGPRINDSFELAGIRTCGPDPTTMSQTPQGRFLDGLFRMVEDGFSRKAVTGWLTSSPATDPSSRSGIPSARWDSLSRAAGITSGADAWKRRLEDFAANLESRNDSRGDEDLSAAQLRARSTRAGQARALAAFSEKLWADLSTGFSAWSEASEWLRALIGTYLAEAVDEVGSRRNEWALGLAERIGSLDGLEGIEPPTRERLASMVRQELDRPLRTSRSIGAGVFVGLLSDAVGCVFDVVHIVGMREGLFPPVDRPDPLLPDDARELIDPEGALLPGRRRRSAIHRRRFLAAMATAERVVLYWPRSDTGSIRESAPAPWFVEQARRYPGCEGVQAGGLLAGSCSNVEWHDGGPGDPEEAGDVSEYDENLAANWALAGRSADSFPLADEDGGSIGRAIALLEARRSTDWTMFDGDLSDAGGFSSPAGPVSATRYEKYAACPFRYFLGEIAGVEPTDKPEDQLVLDALGRGTLVHRILEQFVKSRRGKSTLSVKNEQERLNAVAELEFRKFERESPTGHPMMWALAKTQILRDLGKWLESEVTHLSSANWGSHRLEQEFGTGNERALPAARIVLDDGRVIEFRGVIDRVDVSADGTTAAVFDYKTGSPNDYRGLDDDPVLHGTKLQLAVYSAAIRDANPDFEEIRSSYWFVFEDPARQFVPSLGEFNQDDARRMLQHAVGVVTDGISRGSFPARPGEPAFFGGRAVFKNCSRCEYDKICPTFRQRFWERKRSAKVLGAYVDLTGDLGSDE